MLYKTLGTSDLKISEIALGCMSLDPSESGSGKTILMHAFDAGINYFDTADIYDDGANETLLGRTFKGKRDKILLATKVGNQRRADGRGLDWNPRKSYILSSVEKSLERLQTDYIDLYQLHGGTIDDPMEETIDAFETLKTQGKIRYYGISSIRPNVIREYVHRSSIVSVMTQYSAADRRPEEEILELLKSRNIGVLARGAVAQGILSSKPSRQYLSHTDAAVNKAKDLIAGISTRRTPTQTLLKYVLQNKNITAPVVGVSSLEQLKELIGTLSTPELTTSEIELINAALPQLKYTEHR